MKTCRRCVMPSSFPGIFFNSEGICNHCAGYRPERDDPINKARYQKKFQELLDSLRNHSEYDVLVAYSGGKDSTFTLDMLVNDYRARVLALTFDNTFMSPKSFKNGRTVCDALGVDLMVIRANRSVMTAIFRRAAKEDLFPQKTLERASCICTSCISLVKGLMIRTAIEKNIPFVGYGWSPGQAPIRASIVKTGAEFVRYSQSQTITPLYRIAGDAVAPYFVSNRQFYTPDRFPWIVHPLAFTDYDEEAIIRRIGKLGWERPDDTDPNSSNCLLNSFANYVHIKKYGYNPYVWEIANMVRSGYISRDEGLAKINAPGIGHSLDYVKSCLTIK